MENPWNYVSDSHASHVIDAITELRKNKELCDVILLVNGHCIPAHRLILSACSPYFHGLFEGPCHSSHPLGNHPIEVPLSGIDACAAENAIDYCYTSHLVIDDENVWSLLPAASLLQLEEVQNVCCDFLKGRLTLSNCVRMRLMSSSCHCEELRQLCDDYIRNNFDRILSSEDFLGVSAENLIVFLSQCLSQRLLSEISVSEAVNVWVGKEKEQRAACISMISRRLPCVPKLLQIDNIPSQPMNSQKTPGDLPSSVDKRDFPQSSVCSVLLPSQQALQGHVAEWHEGSSTDPCRTPAPSDFQKDSSSRKASKAPETPAADLDIICQICNKHYHSDIEMTNHCLGHMEGYSPAPEQVSTPAGTSSSPERPDSPTTNYIQSSSTESFLSKYKGEKRYCCKICGEETPKESQMYGHCAQHHGYGDTPLQCQVCQKTFHDKAKLLRHLVHHSTVVYFCCPFCDKQSRTKANLQIHMRIHTGERPYVCVYCNKGFRNYCVLKVHVRSHTGEKPFSCNTCGQSFTKNIHLKRHVSTHSGEKPFSCDICGKGFGRNDHLQRHIKTIHTQEKPHGCNLCGKDFVRRYELERHMRFHMKKGSAKNKAVKRKQVKAEVREKQCSEASCREAFDMGGVDVETGAGRLVYDRRSVTGQPYPPNPPDMLCVTNHRPSLISLDNCSSENSSRRPEHNNNYIDPNQKDFGRNRFVSAETPNFNNVQTAVDRTSESYRFPMGFEGGKLLLPEQKGFAMETNPVVMNPTNASFTLPQNGVATLSYPIQ